MNALPPHIVARLVREALLEDVGPGDMTTAAVIDPDARARARITAGGEIVVAGVVPAMMAFHGIDPGVVVTDFVSDGGGVRPGGTVLSLEGRTASILPAERVALNFLGFMSGIATCTRQCVNAVAGTRAAIYDTRKTHPGLRLLERHAVAAGGGTNHRFGLHDAILIKDNHIAAAGGVGAAVRAAVARAGGLSVEVEIDSPDQVDAAIAAGASVLLLDNMPPERVAEITRSIRSAEGDRIVIEASGGITRDNVRAYAEAGVDRISLGWITHSAPAADLSLHLETLG